jgi:2-desacetyl-2-hydroxyethyl bacteriochlorophyllide A dehydrogenase
MKAALFDRIGKPLVIDDVEDPKPQRGQLLLKVCRCGICGSDLHMTAEEVFGVRKGDVLGHEFSGEIVEIGSDASGLKVGDQVSVAPIRGCGTCTSCLRGEPAWCEKMTLIGGGYAQYAAVEARQCRRLPWGISAADGALAEPLAVGLHGVTQSGLKPENTVLIVGAGAIGLAVAFWARRQGARKVVLADLTDMQAERAMALGATGFVVSDEEIAAKATTACDGPPDIVFECVGRPGMIDHCISLVRPRGKVVVLGLCTAPDHMDSFRAISKEVTIAMSVFFNMHEFANAIDALDSGRFAPQNLISDLVGLKDMPTTFEALRKRTTQCKVLIDPFAE